ncbi:MAG: MBL fold metallo-hydrolase [Thermodesulfobacteriota bacterium]
MKIVENLYFYPWESYTQNNANSILITGPVKALVDPGHRHLFPELERKMRADGTAPGDIDLVIYTHCHPDHMEAGEVLGRLGVRHALHPDDEAYLRQIGPAFYQALGLQMPDLEIDVHLVEGDLTLGDKTFEVYHTPGHSPGEVCLYWPDHRLLIAGDLIFAQGVGRTDFPGGSGRRLKESIERMAGLDLEIILPGHGPAIVGRDNVRLNFQAIERMYFPML